MVFFPCICYTAKKRHRSNCIIDEESFRHHLLHVAESDALSGYLSLPAAGREVVLGHWPLGGEGQLAVAATAAAEAGHGRRLGLVHHCVEEGEVQ